MRRVVFFLCLVAMVPAATVDALDSYPKTQLAEDVTATWCGYCPDAYAGLEVCHNTYDYSDFISVRYYATSGDYGTAETDARIAYYGVTAYPTVIFDGQLHYVGGGASVASGVPYMGIIDGAYFNPAPIKISIDSLNTTTGEVQATVTMVSETETLSNDHLRLVLLEDNVAGIHTHMTRDIINTTIALSGAGNTVVHNDAFVIDPSWNAANLWAMAFVQRASDKEVVQAASSHAIPAYKARAIVPFPRVQIGPSSGEYVGEHFAVTNVGGLETFQIELIVDDAPGTWVAEFCDQADACYSTPQSFSLATDEQAEFYVKLTPDSLGQATYHILISSPNLAKDLSIEFSYLTAGFDAIVVDDDGGETFENYFTAALDAAGKTYAVWDLSAAKLTAEVAATYDILIWNAGWAFPSIDADDRAFLAAYLDAGKSLFITGQDIGWDLASGQSDNTDVNWYRNYLHANYESDDTNLYDLSGVAADPITDGMTLHIAGGDGANNQQYPSQVGPFDADGVEMLTYTATGGGAAIRSTDSTSGARVVYLAFGFEAIDNPTDRADLLGTSMDWLAPAVESIFIDGFESGDTSAWTLSVP